MQQVSLILTVYNESGHVDRFFDALAAFTRKPDEVVIVDGGSTDDTVARIRARMAGAAAPVKLIAEGRCNIARGRNLAIEHARHDLLAITDMGCRIPPEWLERIIAPFEEDASVDVVGGYYGFHAETPLQECFGHLRVKDSLDARGFLPSSRSLALRRRVWEAVDGYPEDMVVGEDTWFDLRIREQGFKEVVAVDAKVYWEVNRTWRGLFRKYFRYARSAGNVFMQPKVYGVYLAVYAAFVLWIALALAVSADFWTVFFCQLGGYVYVRVIRKKGVLRNWRWENLPRYLGIVFTLDAATALGYMTGLGLRLLGRRERWTPPAHE